MELGVSIHCDAFSSYFHFQILVMKEDEHGMEMSKKIEKIRHELHLKGCNTAIFTALDDIACKYNEIVII